MSSEILQGLQKEWEELNAGMTAQAAPNEAGVSRLKDLLRKCIEAGREVAGIGDRVELQRTAREIADTVFRYSDDYPAVAIEPPSDATLRTIEQADQSVAVSPPNGLPSTGEHLFGRDEVLARLDAAWEDREAHLITIVGWAGVGKSTLVNRWWGRMSKDEWRGAQRVFFWGFSGQGAGPFFDAAFHWFGAGGLKNLPHVEMGKRLAELIRSKRTLLVLDGLETLQFPPGENEGRLRDVAVQDLLVGLAMENPGLCVVTSRQSVKELEGYRQTTAPQIDLANLTPQAGSRLLRTLEVKGRVEDLEAAAVEFDGHALSLNLLGAFLRDRCDGDIGRWRELNLIDPGMPGSDRAKEVVAYYEKSLGEGPELGALRLLGLFDQVATGEEIDILRKKPAIENLTDKLVHLSIQEWHRMLTRLRKSGLLAIARDDEPGAFDAHPLVRAYFTLELRDQYPQAWNEGHRRLYEYHKNKAPAEPSTKEEMRPLFSAIFHGCHAGDHVNTLKEVLQPRILRWNEQTRPRFYSTNTLGLWDDTLYAVSLFFRKPWLEVLPGFSPQDEAFVFTSAGTCLRAQNRFPEAIEAINQGLELRVKLEGWSEAAFAQRMMNQTYLAMGRVNEAQICGEKSVSHADKGEGLSDRISARTRYAESLHHGARDTKDLRKARSLCEEAVEIGRGTPPCEGLGLLDDGFGEYEYCDLLITLGESAAAKERAKRLLHRQTSGKERNPQPLWNGLSLLLLGKIDFIDAGEPGRTDRRPTFLDLARRQFDAALQFLDEADEQQHVPLGYLARANLHCEMGELDKAGADLERVRQLAQPSQMLLHMTDYHLASARLEHRRGNPGKVADHLREAGRLIATTGYHRRDSELKRLRALARPDGRGEGPDPLLAP